MQLKNNRFYTKRPKPQVLILVGLFMLSLYGALTRMPDFLGVIALVTLLLCAAVGAYYLLKSIY